MMNRRESYCPPPIRYSEAELCQKQRQLGCGPDPRPPQHGDGIVSSLSMSSGVLKPRSFTSRESGRSSSITHYQFCPFSKQHRIIF